MEKKSLFHFETAVEKQDYRKFLYIATFKRSKFLLPLIVGLSFMAAIPSARYTGNATLPVIFSMWIAWFLLVTAIVCIRVEQKNKRLTGQGEKNKVINQAEFIFYEEEVFLKDKISGESNTMEYEKLFRLLESKTYYIFYFNKNMATLLRKQDMKEAEGFDSFIQKKFQGKCARV